MPPTRRSIFEATMTEPFGPNHSFMRSGSVKHFHNRSGGASNTRVMTKSPVLLWVSMIVLRVTAPLTSTLCNKDHPADAEPVGQHAKARREERLPHRHGHLPAGGERVESLVGFVFVLDRDRQRKALGIGVAGAAPVRHRNRRVADPYPGVHHFVRGTRWNHRLVRRLLK